MEKVHKGGGVSNKIKILNSTLVKVQVEDSVGVWQKIDFFQGGGGAVNIYSSVLLGFITKARLGQK